MQAGLEREHRQDGEAPARQAERREAGDAEPQVHQPRNDEHALADANYSRQLTEIAQMDGVTLLRLAAS